MRRDDLSLPSPPKVEHPAAPYRCGRGPAETPCAEGPDRRGRCPLLIGQTDHSGDTDQRPCRPYLSWAARRRRWAAGFLLLFSALLTIGLGTSAAPKFVQPGPLSKPHSQILAGTLTSERCATCHDNVSTDAWFGIAREGHAAARLAGAKDSLHIRTTDLCLRCHHDQIDPMTARMAHNLLPETLQRLRTKTDRQTIALPDAEVSPIVLSASSTSRSNQTNAWIGPLIDQESLECSVCHQEHHGADADLTRITDARCQSCHQTQFDSFAGSHPEFNIPSNQMTVGIDFDHHRHATRHFPSHNARQNDAQGSKHSEDIASNRFEFDCRACHQTASGEGFVGNDPIIATLPYEVACASCHDDSLQAQLKNGPALVSLPILPPEAVDQLASWPDLATGLPDGRFSLLSRMLLVDPAATRKQTARKLPDLTDLSTLQWDDAVTQQQVARSAEQTRRFALRLAREGQPALFQLARQAGWTEPHALALARSFSPQILRDALPDWFAETKEGTTHDADLHGSLNSKAEAENAAPADQDRLLGPNDDSLQNNGLLGNGDLLGNSNPLLSSDDGLPAGDALDPLTGFDANDADGRLSPVGALPSDTDSMASLKDRFDAARLQPFGGWTRDDLTLSLRYRGSGHADPVLTGIIHSISRLPPQDCLRRQWLQEPWVQSCLECHSHVMRSTSDSQPIAGMVTDKRPKNSGIASARDNALWRSMPPIADDKRLHRFSHRPHVNIRGLHDCAHCHSLRDPVHPGPVQATSKVDFNLQPHDGKDDFLPLKKSMCVTCHTPAAAGAHCTQCHRYHAAPLAGQTFPQPFDLPTESESESNTESEAMTARRGENGRGKTTY